MDYVVLSDFNAMLTLSQPDWCFRFSVLNDSLVENSESFTIVVSTVETMVDIVPTDMVTVIITDGK